MTTEIDFETELSRALAKEVTDQLGYSLEPDRVNRIAATTVELMKTENFCAADAIARAIDEEILLYGDPNASTEPITGILHGN